MASPTFILLFKVVLVALLFFIAFNLMKGLIQIASSKHNGKKLSHFLGRRVMWSAIVVLLLLLALGSGVIAPNPRPY
ncbi:conserved hypothetical protein [Vibrio chagasii]|jgi:succinate dehydrogenase/fumarate reductase cytochrome b subunit|uniref:DUF2909 domain-containing protein n=1 Tax=Vibrio TaxID=662 RepID=UPI000C85A3EF|nr:MULTISPECIES: DUF2909 domain-containing protein [Vibrio]CAH7071425.1 conserved hypothetical protein [Vibrio chagasii]MCG9690554.1 DUF2909 domain-containing protein [Vibrio sp. Isolate22]NOI95902.1 DUF2909 domain-containing protein [Vibrio sp. T3Y01]PML41665.1 hypothetical protein BCT81_16080 [Vibrio sp. 10N.261.52.A1]PQJ50623.1 hypothetical protein BTO12_11770 [Vibrio splendidus]